MKPVLLASAAILLATLGLSAQTYRGAPGCAQPLPMKIADFEYSDETDLRRRISDLRSEFSKYSEAQAGIAIYGGRSSRTNEFELESRRLRELSSLRTESLVLWDAGFRIHKSFEFFILELPCTSTPDLISDLRVDEVDFTDSPAERFSSSEIASRLASSRDAKCSPAARAVRVCQEGVEVEVFVIINQKGSVVFSKAVSGHPLNRATAANRAKDLQFTPTERDGVPVSISGTIKIVFLKPEEISTN